MMHWARVDPCSRFLVGDGAHLTGDVIEQNEKIVFEIGVHRPAPKVLPQSGHTGRLLRADDPTEARIATGDATLVLEPG